MADLSGFNAMDVEPMGEMSPLPPGDYTAIVSNTEERVSQNSGNRYISVEFTVIEGEYENRKVWTNLNLWNSNQQAADIAKRELSSLCRAVNVLTPKDTSDLHDKPFVLKLGVGVRQDTGDKQNKVKGYAALSTGAARPSAQSPTATGSRPWQSR